MEFDLRCNDRYFVKYHGYNTWHERIALAHIEDRVWLTARPDFDLYPEEISLRNQDIEGLRFAGAPPARGRGRIPPGVANVYQFEAMTAAQARALAKEGGAPSRGKSAALVAW